MKTTQSQAEQRIVENINLDQIYFQEFDARRQARDVPPGEMHLAPSHAMDVTITSPTTFTVVVSLKVEANGPDNSPVMTVACQICLRYRVNAGVPLEKDAVDRFSRFHGLFHAWPYFRELLQGACTRMGLPAIVAPPLQMADLMRASKGITKKPQAVRAIGGHR